MALELYQGPIRAARPPSLFFFRRCKARLARHPAAPLDTGSHSISPSCCRGTSPSSCAIRNSSILYPRTQSRPLLGLVSPRQPFWFYLPVFCWRPCPGRSCSSWHWRTVRLIGQTERTWLPQPGKFLSVSTRSGAPFANARIELRTFRAWSPARKRAGRTRKASVVIQVPREAARLCSRIKNRKKSGLRSWTRCTTAT